MTNVHPTGSYSYAWRRGVLPISWEDYFGICKGLARAVAPYQPDLILGIIRGGMYPATLISHLLRVELAAIHISSRHRDEIVRDRPIWLVRPPAAVAGQKVLIVDEISSQGLTLTMARKETERLGAGEVRTGVMYAHEGGAGVPDYIGIISDALIINPWDREIYRDGDFVPHPEYVDALAKQGMTPPPPFTLGIAAREPEKG